MGNRIVNQKLLQLARNCLSRVFSPSVTDQILNELRLLRTRFQANRVRQQFHGARGLRVNLGSGCSSKQGWVNVDGFDSPGLTCLWDCRLNLPFEDDSVRCLFSEHFLEHLDPQTEVPALLRDILRVLEPGGILRFIVPDTQKYLKAYVDDDWETLARLRRMTDDRVDFYSGQTFRTRMEIVNHVFRQGYEHKFAYDFETLALRLSEAGFKEIQHRTFNESSLPELLLDNPMRADESLYVEATKPGSVSEE